MVSYCILVADGARARLFTARVPPSANAAEVVEREVLLNPERNLPGREEFRNLKTGRNRVPAGGPARRGLYPRVRVSSSAKPPGRAAAEPR